jgi:hypothetical protein
MSMVDGLAVFDTGLRVTHKSYKAVIKQTQDSLEPLKILIERSSGIVKSEIFE